VRLVKAQAGKILDTRCAALLIRSCTLCACVRAAGRDVRVRSCVRACACVRACVRACVYVSACVRV
jgi:hypothetical protein